MCFEFGCFGGATREDYGGERSSARKPPQGHGRYTAYVLDKVDYDTPKLPAWHNKVGDDNGYSYTYTARPQEDEAAAGPRRNAAMDYHHYPTTAANTATTLGSYY